MTFENISYWNKDIGAKIKQNFGLQRIFLWLRGKCPHIGETILISQILNISKVRNRTFKRRTILRIINNIFEEKISSDVKKAILEIV